MYARIGYDLSCRFLNFLFGRYRFCVECDSDTERYLEVLWKKYQTADTVTENDVCIRITKGEFPKTACSSGPWAYSEKDGKVCAVFSEKNFPQFALEYERTGHVMNVIVDSKTLTNIRFALYYALMTAFSKTCIGVHGVTLICDDKLIMLSAPSGTGKTTLANLLHRYQDAAVVNGDYAMLSVDEDGFIYFEPTPFCGSSGICHNYRFTLDKFVYLEQSKQNIWRDLSPHEACSSLLSNCFVPVFDSQAREQILSNVLRVVQEVPASRFAFAPQKEATDIFRKNFNKNF